MSIILTYIGRLDAPKTRLLLQMDPIAKSGRCFDGNY
jgi:hypothetical protein